MFYDFLSKKKNENSVRHKATQFISERRYGLTERYAVKRNRRLLVAYCENTEEKKNVQKSKCFRDKIVLRGQKNSENQAQLYSIRQIFTKKKKINRDIICTQRLFFFFKKNLSLILTKL